jgi:hypothetical protein
MPEFVFNVGEATFTSPLAPLVANCTLFATDATAPRSPYQVRSPVEPAIFALFLSAVNNGPTSDVGLSTIADLSWLCGEFGFLRFGLKLRQFAKDEAASWQ